MRTTLDIDADVLLKVRERAEATGRSLGKIISEMARQAFATAYVQGLPKENGFPQLPFDPRIVVTPERVDELLDETE